MTTAGRRRKSTFLTGQDAVAPSIIDTAAPEAPDPVPEAATPAAPQEAVPAPAAEQQKGEKRRGNATDARRRLQVQMDIDDLAELRSAYNHVAQRGQTLSDFVAGIFRERIHQYRDEINGGQPFGGAGTVARGRPPKY